MDCALVRPSESWVRARNEDELTELILAAGVLKIIADMNGANPAGVLSLVFEGGLVSLIQSAGTNGGLRVLRDCDAVSTVTGLLSAIADEVRTSSDRRCGVVGGVASTEGW